MICPDCKRETYRKLQIGRTADQVMRQLLNCPRCGIIEVPFEPKAVEPEKIAHAKEILLPKNPGQEELKKFLLKEDEIKATQALKPSEVVKEAARAMDERSRELDRLDRPRSTVFIHGDRGDLYSLRNQKVRRKHAANLGTDDFKIIFDDGFKSIAERAA